MRRLVDRILSPPAQNDPLYLSNRTRTQKLMPVLWIAFPTLGVIGCVIAGMWAFGPKATPRIADLTSADIAAKTLPGIDKDLHVNSNKEVDVAGIRVGPHQRGETGGQRQKHRPPVRFRGRRGV